MKRSLLIALLLAAVGTARAQIIQSSALTVEMTEYEKNALKGGYKGMFEAGLGVNCVNEKFNYEFTTAHGYRFASGLFLGAGTGISTLKTSEIHYPFPPEGRLASLPLFVDARWYFRSRSATRFFASTRLGYAIALNKKENEHTWDHLRTSPDDGTTWWDLYINYQSTKLSGLYFSIGFGFEFKRVSLSINYLLQSTLEEYVYSERSFENGNYNPSNFYSSGDKSRSYETSSLMLRIGINF